MYSSPFLKGYPQLVLSLAVVIVTVLKSEPFQISETSKITLTGSAPPIDIPFGVSISITLQAKTALASSRDTFC